MLKTRAVFAAYQNADNEELGMGSFMAWEIAINIYLHTLPIVFTGLNLYFTDIKLLKADWPFSIWHGVFYIFANFIGTYDHQRAVYPIIDW